MDRVPATEFKAKCLELMDRVAERGESYVITKRGRPVAKLVPVDSQPKESLFGWLRGKAAITGDIVGPVVAANAWEFIKEWDGVTADDPRPVPRRPGGRKASQRPRSRR